MMAERIPSDSIRMLCDADGNNAIFIHLQFLSMNWMNQKCVSRWMVFVLGEVADVVLNVGCWKQQLIGSGSQQTDWTNSFGSAQPRNSEIRRKCEEIEHSSHPK